MIISKKERKQSKNHQTPGEICHFEKEAPKATNKRLMLGYTVLKRGETGDSHILMGPVG